VDPEKLTQILTVILAIGAVAWITWLLVSTWRREQHHQAERRVRDRLAQAADPEGWTRRQAHQAQVAALVAEELAAMRRTSWYGRLWSWWHTPG
jgi:hypothetical protein